VEILSIGFTQTTAADFFSRLERAGVERLLDVRLNNRSQLAGFAKRDDLEYFLKQIVGARYEHEPLLAPSSDILDAYKKRRDTPWSEYEERFRALMAQRRIETRLAAEEFVLERTVLLCSEATPEHCHRRLVIEYLAEHWSDVRAVHL
jgi:uncharacterized protein (DUF488 family)